MLRQVLKVSLEFRINFNKLKMCVFEINDFVSTNYSKIPRSNLIWVDLKFGLKQQKYFSLDENIPVTPRVWDLFLRRWRREKPSPASPLCRDLV